MNIFVLDYSPESCARALHDVHLNKMQTETCQILCTAASFVAPVAYLNARALDRAYRNTHANHPCTLWARASYQNYVWLCKYAEALHAEWNYRRGTDHGSGRVMNFCLMVCDTAMMNFPSMDMTTWPMAMPDVYKQDDVVQAYRAYYAAEKLYDKNGKWMGKWTKRGAPSWLTESLTINY